MPVECEQRGRRRGPRGDERPGVNRTMAPRPASDRARADRLPREWRLRAREPAAARTSIADGASSSGSSPRRRGRPVAGSGSPRRSIHEVADELGIEPILTPERLRAPESHRGGPRARAGAAGPRRLRPDRARGTARRAHGALNLHPSLLPRHRGATPIPAAILAGDAETGVTLMRMDAGLDTGPIVAQERVAARRHRDDARSSRSGSSWWPTVSSTRHLGPWIRGELDGDAPAGRGRDADAAAASRGRPPRSAKVRRRAGAPGPRLPAVAGLVRRDAGRGGSSSGRRAPRRPAGRRAGTFDERGLGVGDGERLWLHRGAAGRRQAHDLGGVPPRASRRSSAAACIPGSVTDLR